MMWLSMGWRQVDTIVPSLDRCGRRCNILTRLPQVKSHCILDNLVRSTIAFLSSSPAAVMYLEAVTQVHSCNNKTHDTICCYFAQRAHS